MPFRTNFRAFSQFALGVPRTTSACACAREKADKYAKMRIDTVRVGVGTSCRAKSVGRLQPSHLTLLPHGKTANVQGSLATT